MAFADLKKRFGLPEWTVLNEYFDIGKLEETDNDLKTILKRVTEKVEYYAKFCEDLIQPEGLHNLQEADMLSEDQKRKVNELYQSLMFTHRACVEAELLASEEQAALIKDLVKRWPAYRKDLLGIVTILKTAWKTMQQDKGQQAYFG